MKATTTNPQCDSCGAECIPSGCTTGYGEDANGRKHCFACCGKRDVAEMLANHNASGVPLYWAAGPSSGACEHIHYGKRIYSFQGDRGKIGNWPGTWSAPVREVRVSRHNMARYRYDLWWIGPDGKTWHGVQFGDNTQLVRQARAIKH